MRSQDKLLSRKLDRFTVDAANYDLGEQKHTSRNLCWNQYEGRKALNCWRLSADNPER
jgi:hypothetical protein